jgi:transposase-like protein
MARFSTEEQRKIVGLYRDRGKMTRRAFCQQHRVNPSTLDYWRRKFEDAQPGGRLVAVKLQQDAAPGSFTLTLTNGRRIETDWRFSEGGLGRLIHVAERA